MPVLSHVYNHTNSEYHPGIHVSISPTSVEAIQQKLSHVVLYMFNVEQIWLSCHPENFLNILQSMLSGLEQYITFLLQEWQKNRLNNVLDIHDAVHYSLRKHQMWAGIPIFSTSHHDARCWMWGSCINTLWNKLLPKSVSLMQITIICMKAEPSLIIEL